jgi:cytochrome c oxidase accessory protein FixG
MDERTLNVAYDHRRGEPRRGLVDNDERDTKDGHCIDCTLCVQVCPTGIDIRNGLQAACIGCGLCIDACNEVMTKVHAPTGLIRMASLSELNGRSVSQRSFMKRVLRTRVWVYGSLLLLVIAGTISAFSARPEIRMNVIRDRSVLARQVEQGAVENVYTLQLMNASDHHRKISVSVLPSQQVSLTKPVTLELGPAQASKVTVTVRMPAVEAMQHTGQILPIRFVIGSPETADRHEVEEPSTFLVPK